MSARGPLSSTYIHIGTVLAARAQGQIVLSAGINLQKLGFLKAVIV